MESPNEDKQRVVPPCSFDDDSASKNFFTTEPGNDDIGFLTKGKEQQDIDQPEKFGGDNLSDDFEKVGHSTMDASYSGAYTNEGFDKQASEAETMNLSEELDLMDEVKSAVSSIQLEADGIAADPAKMSGITDNFVDAAFSSAESYDSPRYKQVSASAFGSDGTLGSLNPLSQPTNPFSVQLPDSTQDGGDFKMFSESPLREKLQDLDDDLLVKSASPLDDAGNENDVIDSIRPAEPTPPRDQFPAFTSSDVEPHQESDFMKDPSPIFKEDTPPPSGLTPPREPTPPPGDPTPPREPTPPPEEPTPPPREPAPPPREPTPPPREPTPPPREPTHPPREHFPPPREPTPPPREPTPPPREATPPLVTRTFASEDAPVSEAAGKLYTGTKRDETAEDIVCSWLRGEKLDPKVVELIYWRDVKKSALVFASGLTLLLLLAYCSLLVITGYLSLTVLAVTLTFRIYKNVIQAIQKSGDTHPFKALLEADISLPADRVHQLADVFMVHCNTAMDELRKLFLVLNLGSSIKFGIVMWIMTCVGSWFDGYTILILLFVTAFTWPKIYETNKTQIDNAYSLVSTKANEVMDQVKEKVPMLKKKAKQQ